MAGHNPAMAWVRTAAIGVRFGAALFGAAPNFDIFRHLASSTVVSRLMDPVVSSRASPRFEFHK